MHRRPYSQVQCNAKIPNPYAPYSSAYHSCASFGKKGIDHGQNATKNWLTYQIPPLDSKPPRFVSLNSYSGRPSHISHSQSLHQPQRYFLSNHVQVYFFLIRISSSTSHSYTSSVLLCRSYCFIRVNVVWWTSEREFIVELHPPRLCAQQFLVPSLHLQHLLYP